MTVKTGTQILADDINAKCIVKGKTADQNVGPGDEADADISIPIAANEIWVGRIYIKFGSDAYAVGAGFTWGVPSGASINSFNPNENLSKAGGGVLTDQWTTSVPVYWYGCAPSGGFVVFDFVLVNGANAGNLTVTWNNGATYTLDIKAGTCVVMHRVSPAITQW